jgi:hypothetical protein
MLFSILHFEQHLKGTSANIGFAKARASVVVSTFVFLSIICANFKV